MISTRRFITGASIVEYIPIILAIALALTIGYKSFGDNVREQSAEISAQVAGYGSSNTGGSGNNGSQGNGSSSGNNGSSSDGNDSSNNDSNDQDSTSNDGQGGDSGSNNDSSTGDDNSSSGPIGGGGDSDNNSGGDSDGGDDSSSDGDSGGAVSDGDGDGDDQDTSFIDDAIEFTKGLYEGFKQQGRDFIAMLWSPIETAKQVGELVVNLVERPQETLEIIADELKNDAVKLISGTAFEKGQVLGENLSPAVLLKVVNRLANLPKLPDRGGNDTGSGCSSFIGETEVVTDKGLVPIKELDVNDLVLSRHDATYTDSFNPITKLHSRKVSSYYMIIVGTNIIYTTEEHPFWVQGEGWVPASELEFGNAVATITGDTLIKGVSKIEKEAQVYNLTVANDHTYFIEEHGLWVHNAGACDIISQRFNQLLELIDDPNARERLLKDAEVSDQFREAFIDDPSLLESWKKLDDLDEATLRTDVDWLKRVNDWDSAGIQLSKNGDNLRLGDASGNPLGEFKNGSLIPENGRYQNVGTPVGDIVNGYQIVDNSGQLGIKRVPDESAYNASQLTELTQHPSAHVLERHGHDVADEALIKRANEGIAPDGSYIGNNPNNPPKPPYSSKFETPDQLKLALDNTRPGSAAFNAATTTNGVRVVRHELTGGASYGKGVPRDGNTFVTSTKVRAVYREVSPGNYQLITMFPDF